ncbi:hypothetical protein [Peribacillus muralis]|uniref:hypothetical protein n=1 Tax=Peribacillus muralis TaxID=264697 RepID=UPI003671C65F
MLPARGLKEQQNYEKRVKCTKCSKSHEEEGESYFTFIGNLHLGKNGGILGNGDWDLHGVPVSIYCPSCLLSVIKKEVGEARGAVDVF